MRERDYDEFGDFIPEEYDRKHVTRCEGQYPQGCHAITMERPEHLTAVMVRVLEYVADAWPGPASSNGAIAAVSGPAYGYISKLRYWGLTEMAEAPKDDESGLPGWWRITDLGIRFLNGEVELQRIAWVFRNEVLRYDGDWLDVDGFRKLSRKVSRETVIEEWQPHEPKEDDDGLDQGK